jgi:hypothetical protein
MTKKKYFINVKITFYIKIRKKKKMYGMILGQKRPKTTPLW